MPKTNQRKEGSFYQDYGEFLLVWKFRPSTNEELYEANIRSGRVKLHRTELRLERKLVDTK